MRTEVVVAAMGQSSKPWTPCPRTYAGNMCGIYLDGLPAVPGGSSNPALVLSWFYTKYGPTDRAAIRAAWKSRGYTDVLLSWPDSRAQGLTAGQFMAFFNELRTAGFEPCVMLVSKDFDPSDFAGLCAAVAPLLPLLKQRVGRISVGWELNLFLSPEVLQQFIDWLTPQIVPWGGKLYVHFSVAVASWQPNGKAFADFWNANIGKLTGILYQGDVSWTMPFLQAKLADVLDRFAGQFFCSPDSGFGHPFDCIALELQAESAFNNNTSEAVQNAYGQAALTTPAVDGPLGPVRVMGAGNGYVLGS